jgi:hypothetical protein
VFSYTLLSIVRAGSLFKRLPAACIIDSVWHQNCLFGNGAVDDPCLRFLSIWLAFLTKMQKVAYSFKDPIQKYYASIVYSKEKFCLFTLYRIDSITHGIDNLTNISSKTGLDYLTIRDYATVVGHTPSRSRNRSFMRRLYQYVEDIKVPILCSDLSGENIIQEIILVVEKQLGLVLELDYTTPA